MDKRILDLVKDAEQWKGDPYKLAALVVDLQRQVDREALVAAGHDVAAEVLG